MKKNIFITVLFILFFVNSTVSAQEFQDVDKNPHDIAYFRVNKISPPIIKVLYGRPQNNGNKVFGTIVPYDQVWSVGSNEATEIRFFQDVIFGDKKVKKGTYVMYAIPQEKEWTIILSSNLDVWGTYEYNKKYDVARVQAKVSKAEPIDIFSIGFKEKGKKVNMALAWDTTRVMVPIIL